MMKQQLHRASLFMAVILMASCQTLTPLESKRVNMATVKDTPDFCNFYNSDTRIRYGFGNNDSVFYLKLEALDDNIANSIAMNGLKLFFDATDRKQKDICLNFPMKNTSPKREKPNSMSFSSLNRGVDTIPVGKSSDLPDFFQQISDHAEWSVGGDLYQFNWKLQKTPFDVAISKGNIDQLVYEVYIPLDQILKDVADESFTLGIEVQGSDKQSTGKGEMGGHEGGNFGSGSGSGPGGGPGGWPGGAPGGGNSGGDMPKMPGNQSVSTQIFWVMVHLNR